MKVQRPGPQVSSVLEPLAGQPEVLEASACQVLGDGRNYVLRQAVKATLLLL
jgi:hypothetical protein